MITKEKFELQHEIPLLLFGLAAMGFSVRQLLEISGHISIFFATLIMTFGLMASVLGLVKYWRYN